MSDSSVIQNGQPLVSVILPVYNAGHYLKDAIESILNQGYRNVELIILNDGSTDNSEKTIQSYSDPRIRYFSHDNCGLAGTLNKGLSYSTGTYIARQDQDDISHPERLSRQVSFLQTNPDIILLGTRARIISDTGVHRAHDHATLPAVLKFDLMFDNPFVHSSVMFRKKDLERVGYYNTDRSYFEDYDLWSRFAEAGQVANLGDRLLDYRHHEQGLSKSTSYFKESAVFDQSLKNIETLMGHSSPVYNDLAALYHWHEEKCTGVPRTALSRGLEAIARRIMELYPGQGRMIKKRLNEYKNVIAYRVNKNKRNRLKDKPLRLFLLKVESKLRGLHPNISNE